MRDLEIKKWDIVPVEGKDKIIIQDVERPTTPLAFILAKQGHFRDDHGAIIYNIKNVDFGQMDKFGAQIVVQGTEITKSRIFQGHGNDILYMKDAAGISGNDFDAGSRPTGAVASAWRIKERVEALVRKTVGAEPSLGIDSDLLVLEGEKEDYQFTFNPPRPETKGESSVTIKHVASGAENRFTDYDYLVFGGRGQENDIANYVKISSLKAEQEARKAVENTQEKIAPQTGDGEMSCRLPLPAKGDELFR